MIFTRAQFIFNVAGGPRLRIKCSSVTLERIVFAFLCVLKRNSRFISAFHEVAYNDYNLYSWCSLYGYN